MVTIRNLRIGILQRALGPHPYLLREALLIRQ